MKVRLLLDFSKQQSSNSVHKSIKEVTTKLPLENRPLAGRCTARAHEFKHQLNYTILEFSPKLNKIFNTFVENLSKVPPEIPKAV